jgi:FOG: WD40-like repeat
VDGDLVYIGSYSGKVLALSTSARSQDLPFPQVRSGEWLYPGTEGVIGGIVGAAVISEDTIYVASSDGRVYSLDKGFGDLNWKSDILDEKLWTTPVIEGDTIYVSTLDGHIYTLSTKTGSLLPWSFKAEVGFVSSPVLYGDTIFVGSFDRNLCAVKIGDVETLWEFPGGRWFWATPVVKDGVVYAGCLDGKIYAVAADTGEELWEFDAGSPVVASPVLVGDLLVVAAEAGDVYVFDTSARPQDKVMTPVRVVSIDGLIRGSLCAQDSIVYVRTQDNCVYAVDVDKGKISWSFPLTIKEES